MRVFVPATHKQFRASNVTYVVGSEKHYGLGDLIRCSEPAEGTALESIFKCCCVSVEPGLTAFTRMRRALRSVVHVRANERTAAFVAL